MRFSRHLTLMATASFIFYYPAFQTAVAEQPMSVIESEATLLPPLKIVIYGANRRATTVDDSVATVTVVTNEDLQRTPAIDLPSFLNTLPGVAIQANGGQGSNTTVALRGTSAAQTLVVLDGVRISSATTGAAALQNIPLSLIDRIEIIRGPRSSVYGSDAIGGVVAIFTKRGGNCPNDQTSCTTITTGFQTPLGGYLDLLHEGSTLDGLYYNFGGRIFSTEGYNFTYPSKGPWGINEPDNDGFTQGAIRGRIQQGYDWGTISATGSYSKGVAEYDNSPGFDNLSYSEVAALSVAGDIVHDDTWQSHLEATFGFDKSLATRDEPQYIGSNFDTYRYGVLGSTTKQVYTGDGSVHSFTIGGEVYREVVDSVVNYDLSSRTLMASYGQYEFTNGALTVNAMGRYDHIGEYGGVPTYNIGAGYQFTDWLSAKVSYGTGFRVPTFNDLYYPGFSNPDLRPENSQTFEAGVSITPFNGASLDITAYRTTIDDMIAYDSTRWNVFNINQAQIDGVEVALAYQLTDQLNIKGSADFMSPVDLGSGNQLRYRPQLKMSGELSYTVNEQLLVIGTVTYLGERYADIANQTKLPGVATFGAALEYKVDGQTSIRASVDNLFDTEYSLVEGYRAPGRAFKLSLTSKF